MAIPGSVVAAGKLVTPGGQQGPQGNPGQILNLPPLADTTQDGLLRKVSGNVTDYVGGDNNCHYFPSIPNCGRLVVTAASPSNTIQFLPYYGDVIKINGAFYQIPAAGITATYNSCYIDGVAGSTLAVNVVYLVYLFNNAGTLTIDFSVTGHVTSATSRNVGVETKSGDDTRTLIGIISTDANSKFNDTVLFRYVRSWFNRTRMALSNSAGLSITATTPTLYMTLATVCFAGETLSAAANVYGTGTVSTNTTVSIALDGVAASSHSVTTNNTTAKYENMSVSWAWTVTEGRRTIGLYANSAAASTFAGSGYLSGTVG